MSNLMPDVFIQSPHLLAFDELFKSRLNALEIDKVLIYMINTVDASALYWLAQQFDLLGHKGWKLANTAEKKREIIKKAIELHRFKGSIWAVKEALRSVGFPNAEIVEHVDGHWAKFKIYLNPGGDAFVDAATITEVVKMVNEYKNVRSVLYGIEWVVEIVDGLSIEDNSYETGGEGMDDGISVSKDFLYNGEYFYDGSKNYNSDSDTLEIEILEA